jgi:Recombination endonuclease VII
VTCCNDGDHEHGDDPERRKRRLASQRKYRLSHKKERTEYARWKRHTDPVHREGVRAYQCDYQRKKRFKEVYGITIEDYNAMFIRQGGACAVCRRTGQKLVVDHCHLTGKVRALLCSTCNSALGFWRDNANIIRAAAAYLEKYRPRPCGDGAAVLGVSAIVAGATTPYESAAP